MRLLVCFLIIALSSVYLHAEPLDLNDQLFSNFYDLWKASAFGKDPNRTERAAWIINGRSGQYEFIRWPTSGERNREFWVGAKPANALAQVHTHTVIADPRPAPKDIQLCKKIAVPMYTVSGSGIWLATPEGTVVQVADSRWYKKFEH